MKNPTLIMNNIVNCVVNVNNKLIESKIITLEEFDFFIENEDFVEVYGTVNSPLIVTIVKLSKNLINCGMTNSAINNSLVAFNMHSHILFLNKTTGYSHVFLLTHSQNTLYKYYDINHSPTIFKMPNIDISYIDYNLDEKTQRINIIPFVFENPHYSNLLNKFEYSNIQDTFLQYSLSPDVYDPLTKILSQLLDIQSNLNTPFIKVNSLSNENPLLVNIVLKNWNETLFKTTKNQLIWNKLVETYKY